MHLGSYLRRIAAIGSALAVLAIGAPSTMAQTIQANPFPYTLLATALPNANTPQATNASCKTNYNKPMAADICTLTVNITDKGYDNTVYQFTTAVGATAGNVTFKNVGTQIHTATAVPGTGGWGVGLVGTTDGQGNQMVCYEGQPLCGKAGALDTGGIPPGGSATFTAIWRGHYDPAGVGTGKNINSVYYFTSFTDCLGGNSNPNFNCTPSQLVALTTANPSTGISISTQDGSVFDVPGSPDCAPNVPTFIFSAGPNACLRANGPGHNLVVGPSANGVTADPKAKPASGLVQVNIDDIYGFQPTDVTVTGGTTVQWTNTGQRVHDITFGQGGGTGAYSQASSNNQGGPNAMNQILATLGPGQSAQFTFDCNVPWPINTCYYNVAYTSKAADDLIPRAFDGNAITASTTGSNIGVANCNKASADSNCGRSGMQAQIYVVAPPNYAPSF